MRNKFVEQAEILALFWGRKSRRNNITLYKYKTINEEYD